MRLLTSFFGKKTTFFLFYSYILVSAWYNLSLSTQKQLPLLHRRMSMYQLIKGNGLVHDVFVSNVAPPEATGLDKRLQDLTVSHILLSQGTPLTQYAEVLATLDTAGVDKARLQLQHTFHGIAETVEHERRLTVLDYMAYPSFNQLILHDANEALASAKHMIEQVEATPKKQKRVAYLIEVIKMLTEAQVVLENHVADNDNATYQQKVQQFVQQVGDIATQYNAICALGSHYQSLQGLASFQDIQADAVNRVKAQIAEEFIMDFSRMERAEILCGERSALWHFVQQDEAQQKEMIEKRLYSPLDDSEAQSLKDVASQTFKAMDKYQSAGFVNRLLAMSAMLDYEAVIYLNKADRLEADKMYEERIAHIDDFRKRVLGFRTYDQEFLDKDRDEAIAEFKENKHFSSHYATAMIRDKDAIIQNLNLIGMKLGNENKFAEPVLTLTGDIDSGFVVGRFNHNDQILFIHKDQFVEVQNAIFAARLTQAELDDFTQKTGNNPAFNKEFRDYLQEVNNAKFSNFMSYGQFINELKDEYIQNYFFGTSARMEDKTELKTGTVLARKHMM